MSSKLMRRVAVLVVVLASTRAIPAQQPDFSPVRELINSEMGIGANTPSIAVAVARGPNIIWEEGFGWVDRPGGRAATANTLYYAASVTKTVTATALMVLHERNRLDFDRPANSYLKTAKLRSPHWKANDATVKHLATHTAGLTTYDAWDQIPPAETIRRYGVIFWPPGNHFDYSNLGFGILGQIITDVSGRSFQSFVHDEVLRPLGMATTWAGATPTALDLVAPRYSALLRDFSPPLAEPTLPGASVLYASAHELALFGMFHLKSRPPSQKPILSNTAIDELQKPLVTNGNQHHSLAWSIDDNLHGYRTLLAQGGTFDAQAWLMLIPSEKIAVVVLANYGNVAVMRVIDRILAVLLPAYRADLEKTAAAVSNDNAPAGTVAISSALVGGWSGEIQTYRGNVPLAFTVNTDGSMTAALRTQAPATLTNDRINDNRVIGRIPADLGIDYAGGAPYELRFELYQYGEKMFGAAVTYAVAGRDGPRLPFWVELNRKPAK